MKFQDFTRTDAAILLVAGTLTVLSLYFLIYWQRIVAWLARQFPGNTSEAWSVAFLFLMTFSLAEALVIGLVLSSGFRVNRWLSAVFQSGSMPREGGNAGRVAFLVGSILITTMFMTLVYVVPAIPGTAALPSFFGIGFSFATLLNSLAAPGQPLAVYIQVGLMSSGPATMFWARLEGIYNVRAKAKTFFPRVSSYATWLTIIVLLAYFAEGGGTVQGAPTGEIILIWGFQSLIIAGLVFLPLEKLIMRFSADKNQS
jgi:hypothetical protein